jgi:hypothetical protein
VLAHGPGAVELAVGTLQALTAATNQGRDERLGGGVDQGLPGPQQEPDDRQQRDSRPAGQHRQGEHPDQDGADGIHGPHDPPSVPAVDQRPADQPEQQPRQPASEADQRHLERVTAEGGRQ